MSMRVLMIAPPGAGKGMQGALIAAHYGIPRIATGELLRDHVARRTDLGLAGEDRDGRRWWPSTGETVVAA
jgi:adenylate kinase